MPPSTREDVILQLDRVDTALEAPEADKAATDKAAAPAEAAKAVPSTQFFLQAGSFRKREDAEEAIGLREQLASVRSEIKSLLQILQG